MTVQSGRAPKYADYLKSDEWAVKREAVKLRALGRCEFCGAAMEHVHHVRYPKSLGEEPLSDLIAVCKGCHDKSHGVRKMELELAPDPRVIEVVPPTGRRFAVCASINGNAYATIESWAENLLVPPFRLGHFVATIEGLLLGAKAPGRLPQAKFNSMRVVSWQVIAEALRATDRKYHNLRREWKPGEYNWSAEQWREMCAFVDRIDAVTRWGWDMQSQALAGRVVVPAELAIPENLAQMMRILGSKAIEHDGRIEKIEAITLRDGGEFITVNEALLELALDAASIVRGGQNLSQYCGVELRSCGATPGEKRTRRLDGSAVRAEVNTWRRSDIYRVAGELDGRNFMNLLVK